MKILIINGSPRRSGTTATLLKNLMTLIPDGIDSELLNISGAVIQPCVGCLKCRPDKVCVLPEDDAHRFGKMIRDADIVVVGTPVYWGNIPGPLKTLFDRNIPVFEFIDGWKAVPQLSGKKAVFIISSGSSFPANRLAAHGGGAYRALRTIFRSGGFKISATVYTDCGNDVKPGIREERRVARIIRVIKKTKKKLM